MRQAMIKRDGKEHFIRAKYERSEFMDMAIISGKGPDDIAQMFDESVQRKDACGTLRLWRICSSVGLVQATAPLHMAVHAGDDVGAELLIQNGVSLNDVDDQRNTPLHVAAAAGCTEIVELLLQKGASFTALNSSGQDCMAVASGASVIAQLAAAKDALETKLRKAEEKKAQDALRAKQREEEMLKREAEDKAKADASFFSRVSNFFSSDKDKQETKQVLSSFLKRRPSMADVQGKFSPVKP